MHTLSALLFLFCTEMLDTAEPAAARAPAAQRHVAANVEDESGEGIEFDARPIGL